MSSAFTGIKDRLSRIETGLSNCMELLFFPVRREVQELQVTILAGSSEVSKATGGDGSESAVKSEEGGRKIVLCIRGLTKIFGARPEKALKLLESGLTKEEVLKKSGSVVGLKDVNLDIYEGEIFVVMGLSGSGKSTLLRCLNRLVEPTAGTVSVDSVDIRMLDDTGLRSFRRRHMGMVFQNFGLLPHRTILDNVAYGLEVQGMPRVQRYAKAKRTLEMVGLEGYESSYPSQMSGGMKQRVGLARALATDPDILLMDEAFSALDPLIRRSMQDELMDLHDKLRKTIVFVTHDLDEALRLGERIAIMKDGQIAQVGTPEEILTNPANDYVASFLNGIDRSKVLTCESLMKRPELVIPLRAGPRTALKMLDDSDQVIGFVVDKDKHLIGLVQAEDLLKGLEGNVPFGDMIRRSVRTVTPETKVEELISILVETNYPVPVLDEKQALIGVIYPGSVMDRIHPKMVRSEGVTA